MTKLKRLAGKACVAAVALCLIGLTLCLLFPSNYLLGTALMILRWPSALLLGWLTLRQWRGQRALKKRLWPLLFLFLLLTESWVLSAGRFRSEPLADEASSKPLTIMSYNLLFAGGNPAATLERIRTSEADLIALQELTPAWERRLDSLLKTRLPFKSARANRGTHGFAIYSRYPLGQADYPLNFAGRPFAQCLRVILQPETAPLELCNLHLASPSGALHERGLDRIRALNQNESTRRTQWQTLLAREGAKKPQLIVGDLNTTEYEPLHRKMLESFTDAIDSLPGTWRASPTWPNLVRAIPPLVRIDYVLVSAGIQPIAGGALKGGGSDHLAIVAKILVPAARVTDSEAFARGP